MTLNEALILSYIKRGISYGYSIMKHVRRSRSDEWVEFSRAGLYKTLDKLERNGMIVKSLEQSNGRPPKHVFTITGLGETELSEYIDNGFDFHYQPRNELDAYLVTAVAASPDATFLSRKIDKRIDAVNDHIQRLKGEWPEDKAAYPLIVYALYRRRMEFLEHELEWLTWLKDILGRVPEDVLSVTWGDLS